MDAELREEIVRDAIVWAAVGFDIILADAVTKNPGIVKNWPTYDWKKECYERVIDRGEPVSLAIRLGEMIDIEIDAEDAEVRQRLEYDFLADTQGTKTVSWRSRRGRHWLFRLSKEQEKKLKDLGAPAVIKGKYEYRLGFRPAQSLLPTPGDDYRTWVVRPEECFEPAIVPDNIFGMMVDAATKNRHSFETLDPVEQDEKRPGDLFNENTSWDEILTPHGWTKLAEGKWRRPGKQGEGISATTSFCHSENRGELFYCFSTAVEIDPIESGKGYSKFELWATLEHNGNFSAAAAEAVRRGFIHREENLADEFDDGTIVETAAVKEPAPETVEEKLPTIDPRAFDNIIGKYALDLFNNYNIEADPAGIMFQAFEIFGCLVGFNAHILGEDGPVYPNDFLMVVGDRATGRKGTSWKHAERLFASDKAGDFTAQLLGESISGRVDSGEGLVRALLRNQVGGQEFAIDEPLRLLIQDSEAIGFLNKMKIENSTLQQNMMTVWDGRGIGIARSKEQAFVKKPIVSFVGHTQPLPLKDALTENMDNSGFVSRFQFICTEQKRTFLDPPPMPADRLLVYHNAVDDVIRWSASGLVLSLAPRARSILEAFYTSKRGMVREHRHAMKNAMRLAVLRKSKEISEADMANALLMQHYAEECYKHLFRDWGRNGQEADDKDKVYDFLSSNQGSSVTDISSKVFSRNKKHAEIKKILRLLKKEGLVTIKEVKGFDRYIAVPKG